MIQQHVWLDVSKMCKTTNQAVLYSDSAMDRARRVLTNKKGDGHDDVVKELDKRIAAGKMIQANGKFSLTGLRYFQDALHQLRNMWR